VINLCVMGAAYAMLHAVHGVADYWIQSDWMAQNKTKNWKALLLHVTTYSLAFFGIGWTLMVQAGLPQWKCLALPLVIGIPHAWMDRRRFLTWFCEKTKGWKPEDIPALTPIQAAVRVHVSIHMDQKFHYLCLMLTAAWLAWGL
jgi:hypothetical protein